MDDSAFARSQSAGLLRGRGQEVAEAGNQTEGLRPYRHGKLDGVLLDTTNTDPTASAVMVTAAMRQGSMVLDGIGNLVGLLRLTGIPTDSRGGQVLCWASQ